MKEIITKIECCRDCPYNVFDPFCLEVKEGTPFHYDRCVHLDLVIEDNKIEIQISSQGFPEWCPLKDVLR